MKLKIENYKTWMFVCLLVLSSLIFVNFVSAVPQLYVEIQPNLDINRIMMMDSENIYYQEFPLVYDEFGTNYSFNIQLYGINEKLIHEEFIETEVRDGFTFNKYSDQMKIILSNESDESEKEVAYIFCNNNNICESCEGENCNFKENFVSCPNDCPSGSEDYYCDLEEDGICDPDCDNVDADCSSCDEIGYCLYSDSVVDSLTCAEDLGGNICTNDEVCLGGEFEYAEDSGWACCVGGICYNEDDYQELDLEQGLTDVEEVELVGREYKEVSWFRNIIFTVFFVLLLVGCLFYYMYYIKPEHRLEMYFRKSVDEGYPPEHIRNVLVNTGWNPRLVEKVMRKFIKR